MKEKIKNKKGHATPFAFGKSLPKIKINNGFTLIELIVYVAAVSIVIGAIIIFAIWATRLGTKIKINYAISNNARRAMETMVYEIKKSRSAYTPTSIFATNPGQLSLQQVATTTPGEITTYVDFFKCGDGLCLKKEGAEPQALTSSQVKITNLIFTQILNASTTSIQINLGVKSTLYSSDPRYETSINLISTATLPPY
jgi:type II secretory pathway pseudopilin PulG